MNFDSLASPFKKSAKYQVSPEAEVRLQASRVASKKRMTARAEQMESASKEAVARLQATAKASKEKFESDTVAIRRATKEAAVKRKYLAAMRGCMDEVFISWYEVALAGRKQRKDAAVAAYKASLPRGKPSTDKDTVAQRLLCDLFDPLKCELPGNRFMGTYSRQEAEAYHVRGVKLAKRQAEIKQVIIAALRGCLAEMFLLWSDAVTAAKRERRLTRMLDASGLGSRAQSKEIISRIGSKEVTSASGARRGSKDILRASKQAALANQPRSSPEGSPIPSRLGSKDYDPMAYRRKPSKENTTELPPITAHRGMT